MKMIYCSKNKNELLVLTGAVYSFVAYLTAFTLEVLFIIDLAKRNSLSLTAASSLNSTYDDSIQTNAFEQARIALETMQTHVIISCLAISVLYFIIFVASLILIVALILRSTFFLLTWMCIMTTMYLPEFGLIIYVSIYGWGIETRNGQTELIFYLIRATLNVIFILRANKLYKIWNYEKNFFMLKSNNRYAGYDSPYFIGDSLTTTINPVFSSSTLNFDRYDQIRDFSSPTTNNSFFPDYDDGPFASDHLRANQSNKTSKHANIRRGSAQEAYNGFQVPNDKGFFNNFSKKMEINNNKPISDDQQATNASRHFHPARSLYQIRPRSVVSINDNDDFTDYEMDLDYRTLTNQRHYKEQNEQVTGRRSNNQTSRAEIQRSPDGMSYSTQSLDRRHLRDMDFTLPEHVILKPLGHQPFDYLQRPGSTSNLNSINNLNTQPSTYSNLKLAKRSDFNLYKC